MNREILRLIGDAIVFFALFGIIFVASLGYGTMGISNYAALGVAAFITVLALLSIYIQRAIFYYLVKPRTLRASVRWIAKVATLYVINSILFGIVIIATPAKPPFSSFLLIEFVFLTAMVLLVVEAAGDYAVFRIMAAATRRAR